MALPSNHTLKDLKEKELKPFQGTSRPRFFASSADFPSLNAATFAR